MRITNTFVTLLLITSLHGVCNAQIFASLDENSRFVLTGAGEEVMGVDILSASGGLVPVASNNAAPFTFFLSNTPNQITYGNLGTSVTIDGDVTLSAGWDPSFGEIDAAIAVGIGSDPVAVAFGPCETNCPVPKLGALVNSDLNVVLDGRGQVLTDITFRSPSGSLSPATSPAPFAQSVTNTANEVKLASPGSQVTLDGQVTLGVGWNPQNYTRDIEFEYQLFEGTEASGPYSIAKSAYAYELPKFPIMDVKVNNDDQFVILAAGQPIKNFSLISSNESLIPGEGSGPFDSVTSNTTQLVSFAVDELVTLDGEIVLPTRWDATKPKTIKVEYDLPGELGTRRYFMGQSKFPNVPTPGREPLLITLDEDNNYVVTGIGQGIGGIEFVSPTGALRPTEEEAVAPFPIMLSNTSELIVIGVLGQVEMDGSFSLGFGPTDPALASEIEINVGYDGTPSPNPFNIDCPRCDFPAVVLSEDRGIVLENFPQPVKELTFSSKNGGLNTLDSLPNGLSLINSTTTELVIGSDDGFDAFDMSGLSVAWGSSIDSQVFVSFEFLDGTSFGPLPLQVDATVPEPSAGLLCVFAACCLLSLRRRNRTSPSN